MYYIFSIVLSGERGASALKVIMHREILKKQKNKKFPVHISTPEKI